MSNFNFLDYLQNSAFLYNKNVILNDYIVDLEGYKSSNFDVNFSNILINTYNHFQEPLLIGEIGSWKGLTTTSMTNIITSNNIQSKIVCIDTWQFSPNILINNGNNINFDELNKRGIGFPIIYYTFINNICKLNLYDLIIPFPMGSIEAANILNNYNIKFNIIFLNCYYDYDSVTYNLNVYWKILKINGYIFGDYYNKINIKNAIDDFSNNHNISLLIYDTFWVINKIE